jgi:hypothetical protein
VVYFVDNIMKSGRHIFLSFIQLTSFLGRKVLSPAISYGRRKGLAGPCHALLPTGKGRSMVFPLVLALRSVNFFESKPDTLL